jgi:hypothetical protein
MESYDVFLMVSSNFHFFFPREIPTFRGSQQILTANQQGNFVALPAFTKDYGVWNEAKQMNVIAPAWQSALQGMFQPFFPILRFSTSHFLIRSLHFI